MFTITPSGNVYISLLQIVSFTVDATVGFIVKLVVITLSQVLTADKVSKYIPAVFTIIPSGNVYISLLQIVSFTIVAEVGRTVKAVSIKLSQAKATAGIKLVIVILFTAKEGSLAAPVPSFSQTKRILKFAIFSQVLGNAKDLASQVAAPTPHTRDFKLGLKANQEIPPSIL